MSYLIPAIGMSIAGTLAVVTGLWGAGVSTMELPFGFGEILHAIGVYLPAIWAMMGVCVVLVGAWPKRVGLIWVLVFLVFFMSYFGNIMGLPEWTQGLTPFGWAPEVMMGGELRYAGVLVTFVVAMGLLVTGKMFYGRREMTD